MIFPNSKGNAVSDTITIVVMLFIFAIAIVVVFAAYSAVNDDIQADPTLSNLTKNVTQHYATAYPSLWDNAFVLAWILLVLGLVVSVIFLDTHPAFFFFSVVGLICAFVATFFLANAYDDLMTDPSLSTFAAQFPFMTWTMTHLLTVSVAIGFIVAIALFIKVRQL